MYLAPGPTRLLKLRWPAEPDYVGEFAEAIVEASREHSQIELDYAPASITPVETLLYGFRDEGCTVDDVAETLFSFGCYVGEVIRGAVGGEWIERGPGLLALVVNGEQLDPIARVFAFLQHGGEASLAVYVAGITRQPIELGVASAGPVEVPPALLRAVGVRLGTLLLAMQENGITSAREPILLRLDGDEVVDDPWDGDATDEDSWRWAREPGIARALIRGPSGDMLGFLTLIATIDPGAGPPLHCAVPTLPAFGGSPFAVYSLQADDALPQAARAEILGGVELIDPAFVSEEPPRSALRIEYLGPRVTREDDYLYAVDTDGVFRTRRRGPGEPRADKVRVLQLAIDLDRDWLYFVDKGGEVARVPMFQAALGQRWLDASDAERADMRAR